MSLSLRPDHERMVRDVLSAHLPAGFTVRVFGSRARGAPKPYSDLDLALDGDAPLSLAALADLTEAFSVSDLPFKVDIVDLRSVGPALRAAIERDGVALDP